MASLKEQLRADLTDSMRARDEVRTATLRMALSAITKAEVAGSEAAELTDDQVRAVIRSELNRRTEAAGIYTDAGRDALAARERAEGDVLAAYLPAQLADAELALVVAEEVAAAAGNGLAGPKAMGAVIKAVRARLGEQAAGDRVAALVKEQLAKSV
ncbi:MAG TPA: GatB/YqeY domain-containing protein [Actinomycetota bacterium]|nr:GatB/YqeY domain-containing protein [Actinomycetota bacterium]